MLNSKSMSRHLDSNLQPVLRQLQIRSFQLRLANKHAILEGSSFAFPSTSRQPSPAGCLPNHLLTTCVCVPYSEFIERQRSLF
jgi:hypothetical protein